MIKFYSFSKILKNKIILSFIMLLILSIKFNFFLNVYLVLIKSADSRMIQSYGYCYPMGYGYIKKIIKEKKTSQIDINIINKQIFPNSNIFLNRFNSKKSKSNFVILLNYKKDDLEKISKNFKILDNENDCYLIKYTND